MKRSHYKKLHNLVKQIKEKVKLIFPIKVVRVKMSKYYGLCYGYEDCFLIKINNELNEDFAIHIFLHEIAHVIAWGKEITNHDKEWGIAYAEIYRKYIENDW